MIPVCIHGVPASQCASCHSCEHGLMASRCTRCRASALKAPKPGMQPPEEHEGYQIFFVPAENSWYYQAPEAAVSRLSYRSAFQARRAVMAAIAAPESTSKASRSSRKAR